MKKLNLKAILALVLAMLLIGVSLFSALATEGTPTDGTPAVVDPDKVDPDDETIDDETPGDGTAGEDTAGKETPDDETTGKVDLDDKTPADESTGKENTTGESTDQETTTEDTTTEDTTDKVIPAETTTDVITPVESTASRQGADAADSAVETPADGAAQNESQDAPASEGAQNPVEGTNESAPAETKETGNDEAATTADDEKAIAAPIDPTTCTHTWDATTGKCTTCGLECTHEEWEYKDEDNCACKICGLVQKHEWLNMGVEIGEICDHCMHERAHSWGTDGKCTTCETECWHDWNDKSECVICGMKCGHEDKWSGFQLVSKEGLAKEISGNDEYHTGTKQYAIVTNCNICYNTLSTEVLDEETGKAHHHYDDNGVCTDCGHKCAHKKTNDYNSVIAGEEDANGEWVQTATYTKVDNKYHTVEGKMETTKYCVHCGKTIKTTVIEKGKTKELHWQYQTDEATGKSMCICGYVFPNDMDTCKHEHRETETTKVTRNLPDNDQKHQIVEIKYKASYCPDCGAYLDTEVISEKEKSKKAHDYTAHGVCRVCGHVRVGKAPEPTATPKPTATPAPTATPVPTQLVYDDVAEMNGVKSADHPAAAAALAAVGAALDGENVKVTIPGAEKILNEAELKTLDTLPVKDRLLVVLSALGFANDDLGEISGMSADAQALADTIDQRLAKLTDADKQALLKAIGEAFPKGTVTVDGATCDSFPIDLVIEKSGNKRYERYTFYDDEGTWKLFGIEQGAYK